MPTDVVSGQNVLDFYRQQLVESKAWYELNTPMYNAMPKFTDKMDVTQRGVRFYFWKSQPGGHTFPTPSQPDFNRTVPPQSDSMYAYALMYAIPLVIDFRTARDAESGKEAALFNMRNLFKQYTSVAAKRMEHLVPGDGTGALAYSASNLAVGAGLTLAGETTPGTAPGHTKGTSRLKANNWYQAWDVTTGLARGTFFVTQEGMSSAIVTVTSGTIASADPITDVGAYNKAPRGLGHLLSDTSRILQGQDTSIHPVLNAATLDLINTRATVSDRETLKTLLVVKNNEGSARANLTWITTPGIMSDLRKQGYGMRRYMGDEPVSDISKAYKDADGSTILEAADMDEDRMYGFKNDILKNIEEFPFGEINIDGLSWRNLLGANQSGSIFWQKAWGCIWTLAITDTKAGVLLKRAAISGLTTQVSAGAF